MEQKFFVFPLQPVRTVIKQTKGLIVF